MDLQILNSSHADMINDYFGDEKINYNFMISDMENKNFQNENFKIYGEIEDNQLKSFLLWNKQGNRGANITYFSFEDRDVSPYKDVLESLDFVKVTGPAHMIEKIVHLLDVDTDDLSHLGVVKNITLPKRYPELSVKRIESEYDLGLRYDLLSSTSEYDNFLPDTKEEFIENELPMLKNGGRTMYLKVDETMVSAASTIAESHKSAIVVGVVTNPAFRNKGYSSEVLIGLFETLLAEGISPYLFYSNPDARSVYKKIGMTEVCQWRVIYTK